MAAAAAPPGSLAVAAEAGEANRAFEDVAVTLEDIQRFTVAEGLSDLERAQLYLSGGEELQELAVVCNLPGLVRAAGRGAWTAVSRCLADVVHRLDEEGQLAAAAAFGTLARERLLPAADLADAILPLALAGANDAGSMHTATQAAWLACLGEVCAAMEPATVHSRVLPVVAERCSASGRELRERCLGCELLGAAAPYVGAEDLQRDVLRLASLLCADTEWQVRHAACQQLPALAAAAAAKADGRAVAAVLEDVLGLHDTLLRLASDGDPEVRLAMAAALPDVAAALGKDRCCQYLRQPVAALLQDERQAVQATLLGRLPEVLEQFVGPLPVLAAAAVRPGAATSPAALALAAAATTAAEEQRGKTCAPFIEPLLRLEAASGYSWRLQLALLHAIAAFPAFFTGEQLHDRFLPLALKYMSEGAAAVHAAAAAAAAAIWRAQRRPAARSALYSRLIHDFGQSKRFRQRLVFIDFCRHAQQLFSTKFMKAHLLEPVLSLAYDPVANVRLHLAAAMPALKQAVALPDDVHLLERLNSAMSHLITDGDSDVCQAARRANEEFKRLPVRMSCGALESSPAEVKAFEAADAARAEAERDFVLDPEALEKVRADIAAYSEQLHPGSSRLALQLHGTRGGGSSSGASTPGGGSRGARSSPPVAPGLAVRVRAQEVAAAVAGGHHRSASDGTDARRDKGAAAGALRSASAGAVGTGSSPGSPTSAIGSGNRSLGFAPRRLSPPTRPHSQGAAGDGSGSDEEATVPHRHTFTGSSGSSRLGRPAAAAVPAVPPAKAAVLAAVGPCKLSRPSPAGSAKRAALPAQQHPASRAATGLSAAPSSLGAAAATAGAAGVAAVAGRIALSRAPAGRADAAAVPTMGQLASKLKAGLQLHAAAGSPALPKAGVGQWLSSVHGSGSGSSGRREGQPPGRSSMQHCSG